MVTTSSLVLNFKGKDVGLSGFYAESEEGPYLCDKWVGHFTGLNPDVISGVVLTVSEAPFEGAQSSEFTVLGVDSFIDEDYSGYDGYAKVSTKWAGEVGPHEWLVKEDTWEVGIAAETAKWVSKVLGLEDGTHLVYFRILPLLPTPVKA